MPGTQVKFAEGGDSWIMAADGDGTVLGADGAQVRQQVPSILPSRAGEVVARRERLRSSGAG